MDHNYFILNNLENFLLYELQPARVAGTLALKPASEWIGLFEQECRAAIQNLKACRYQLSAADFLRHIQLTHADTMDVIGCIRTYERSLEGTPDLNLLAFYPMLVTAIQTVLSYIEGQASFCSDPAQLVPAQELETQMLDLREHSLILRARFKSREVDPELQEILIETLDQFMACTSCSYQDLWYTKKLMRGMAQNLSQSKAADYTMQLISRLICLNFNEPKFYDYVRAKINRLIDHEARLERKCSALRFYSKEIQTLLCKPHLALKPEFEAIQTSLLRFLAAELNFQIEGLPAGALAPGPDSPAGQVPKPEKLRLQTNVHQLGMWIQLLMQTRMVPNEPIAIKNLLQWVADNFSTIGSDQISRESLSRRLYDKDPLVAAKLKVTLQQMIETLDRDYLN